ncbi:MAG: hypothetical protein ACK5MV_13280 [Aminipila sp.]
MLITYFGADAGCGCTMIAQSTANCLANIYPNKKILLLSLSGYGGNDYTDISFDYSMDDLLVKLNSNVLTSEELLSLCGSYKNLYMLKGSISLKQRKTYMPDDITKLIKIAETQFDYIIADAGSSVDVGIGLGALLVRGTNFLITTQSQKAFYRHRQKQDIFKTLDISFDYLVLNKYIAKHFLPSEKLVKDSYNLEKYFVIDYSDYGMQAEEEKRPIEAIDKMYKNQIEEIIKVTAGKEEIQGSTTQKSKSFISGILRRRN